LKIYHVLRSSAWGGLELYSLDFAKNLHEYLSSLLKKKGSSEPLASYLIGIPGSPVERESQARGLFFQADFKNLRGADFVHVHRRQDLKDVRVRLLLTKIPLFYSLYMSAPPKKDLYHRWIYGRLNALASSSEWVCKEVQQNFPLKPSQIHLIRYGRNQSPETWNPEKIKHHRTIMGIKENDIVLCSLSRIDPEKGLATLVDAFLNLPTETQSPLRLWIVGDPTLSHHDSSGQPVFESPSEALYKKILSLSHPRIQYFPFQKDPEIFLQCADVFYLGSTEETYSLAVIDAFQRGKPVLGTQSGGTVEQIGLQQERGYFFRAKDVESLKKAMTRLLNREEQKTKGQAAQEWAEIEHSWTKNLKEWGDIYQIS
jgi:glycosyltransferase involved in cell wall biosynthesis